MTTLERLIAERWSRLGSARRARLALELDGLSLEIARALLETLDGARAPSVRKVRAARAATRPAALPWIGPEDVTPVGLLELAERLERRSDHGRVELFAAAAYARRRAGRNAHLLLRRLLELGKNPATAADEDEAGSMLRSAFSEPAGSQGRAKRRDAAERSEKSAEPVTAILEPLSGTSDEFRISNPSMDRREARRIVGDRGTRAATAALRRRGWTAERVRRAIDPAERIS